MTASSWSGISVGEPKPRPAFCRVSDHFPNGRRTLDRTHLPTGVRRRSALAGPAGQQPRHHGSQEGRTGTEATDRGSGEATIGAGRLADTHRYVFYDFRPSRSRDGPREVLADYRGYLQTDGYIVYTSLVRGGRSPCGRGVLGTWSAGLRGSDPGDRHPLVHEAMIWTQQLYDIEDRAKEMSPEDHRALRQAEALPILTRMAVLDRSAASDCRHRPRRHGCPGSPAAGSLGRRPS